MREIVLFVFFVLDEIGLEHKHQATIEALETLVFVNADVGLEEAFGRK